MSSRALSSIGLRGNVRNARKRELFIDRSIPLKKNALDFSVFVFGNRNGAGFL